MAQYLIDNDVVRVMSDGDLDIETKLPLGTYFICYNEQTKEYSLKKTENFSHIGKTYGCLSTFTNKIINTFERKLSNTGVLLFGNKGSGKTLQAKDISIRMMELGYSTIIVNSAFKDTEFLTTIQKISEPVVVLFDEFEKMYNSIGNEIRSPQRAYSGNSIIYNNDNEENGTSKNDDQVSLLTLLDGVINTKKLFIFTCNEIKHMSSLFLNRPGRVFYLIEFKGLNEDVVKEYCDDKLNTKSWVSQILMIRQHMHHGFTFDIMKAIVFESNLYNTEPKEAVKLLNITPNMEPSSYSVTVTLRNRPEIVCIVKVPNCAILNRHTETHGIYNVEYEIYHESDLSVPLILSEEESYLYGDVVPGFGRRVKTRYSITINPEAIVNKDAHQCIYEINDVIVTLTRREEDPWDYIFRDIPLPSQNNK